MDNIANPDKQSGGVRQLAVCLAVAFVALVGVVEALRPHIREHFVHSNTEAALLASPPGSAYPAGQAIADAVLERAKFSHSLAAVVHPYYVATDGQFGCVVGFSFPLVSVVYERRGVDVEHACRSAVSAVKKHVDAVARAAAKA